MAIGNKKSKMGSVIGVNLNSVQQSQEEPIPVVEPKQSEAKPIKNEIVSAPATSTVEQVVKNSSPIGGRPKFELIAGESEIKVNFHCPDSLYTAIGIESKKQKKSVKQLICEMLLETMVSKYGFKIE